MLHKCYLQVPWNLWISRLEKSRYVGCIVFVITPDVNNKKKDNTHVAPVPSASFMKPMDQPNVDAQVCG